MGLFEDLPKLDLSNKPIRLIELFAGYGSQSLALDYLGVNYESHKICEWAVPSIIAYKDIHKSNDNTDYSKDLTTAELIDILERLGISNNYNKPMTREQIARFSEDKIRLIYNSIKSTNNLVNISTTRAKDLEIEDVDKYNYIVTYSFPCQSLSSSGKRHGMKRGGGTRSGLLWEVERLLLETYNEGRQLPQVLLMENVPDILESKFINDFMDWLNSLHKLGYNSKFTVLNGIDFNVPQNRKRCFCVSWLDSLNCDYEFPKPIKRIRNLNDLLEPDVDDSYYLTDRQLDKIRSWKAYQKPLDNIENKKEISPTITARGAGGMHSGMICINEDVQFNDKQLQQQLAEKLIDENKVDLFDCFNTHHTTEKLNDISGVRTQKNTAITLDTRSDRIVVAVPKTCKEFANYIVENKDVSVGDFIDCSRPTDRMKNFRTQNSMDNTVSPTITTSVQCLGMVVNDCIPIKNNTKQGYLFAKEGDGVKISGRMEHQRGNVQVGRSPTLLTDGNSVGVCVKNNKNNLAIRTLTERECFRLMGVKDSDFDKVKVHQTKQKLYHLAGDSIIVDVLMAIFKQML